MALGRRPAREGDRVLRWTVLAYTFVLALFAIFQFFSSDGLIYWHVRTSGWTFGSYVNHNHYAGLMEMLIPLSIASAFARALAPPQAALVPNQARTPGGHACLAHPDPDHVAVALGLSWRFYRFPGGGPSGRGAGFRVWTPARAPSDGPRRRGLHSLPPRSCSFGWRPGTWWSAWQGWAVARIGRKWNWETGWRPRATR